MTIWYLIETTVNFLQIYVIYKSFDLYYERRFNFKYSVAVAIGIMTVLLGILNYNIPIVLNPYVYIIFFFLIYASTIFIFKGNIFSKAGTIFLLIAILGICELLSALLIISITDMELNTIYQKNFGRLEGMIISQTFFLYVYILMKKKVNKEKMNLQNSKYYMFIGTILFFTVTIIVIVIWMYGNLDNLSDSVNTYLILLTTCVSVLSILSTTLTRQIIADMEEKHKNDMELQQIKMEHKYFSDVNSVLEEIRILRHDMRGELAIIHGYNELNQRDKIKNHIEKKLREMDIKLVPQIDKDNIITSFLNFKYTEAQSRGIDVEIQSNIVEETEVYADKEDICRIINNIMNNAIEANKYCDEKYIKIEISMDEDYINIRAENPFSGELIQDGDKFITTKQDRAKHGYGLKSIKSIAEKYQGEVNMEYENSVFVIEVDMLNKM